MDILTVFIYIGLNFLVTFIFLMFLFKNKKWKPRLYVLGHPQNVARGNIKKLASLVMGYICLIPFISHFIASNKSIAAHLTLWCLVMIIIIVVFTLFGVQNNLNNDE